MNPLVSVIMNCYNGEPYLNKALGSVFAQTYKNWEIIFWDNASQDNSIQIAKSYGSKVRCFRNDKTTSLSKARNKAFSKAQGDFIAILDVDDFWYPDKLECQIKLFEKDEEIGLTISNCEIFNDKGVLYDLFSIITPKRGYVFGHLLNNNFISSETIIFCRRALDGLSYLFDESLAHLMDFDLTLRIAHNKKLDYTYSCLSGWRKHTSSIGNLKSSQITKIKEREIVIRQLEKYIPDLRKNFANEIKSFERQTDFYLGEEAWANGELKIARSYFKHHLRNSRKFMLAYIMSWLYPFRLSRTLVYRIREIIYWLKYY